MSGRESRGDAVTQNVGRIPVERIPVERIRASAGTGKTYTLSGRLIGLLVQGETPGSILATTFTRAAAGEILERVLTRLASAAAGDQPELDGLRELGVGVDAASARDALERLVSELHRVRVVTLDAFLASILRVRSIEMGLGAGLGLLEEAGEADLVDQSVDESIRELPSADVAELVRMLSGGEGHIDVHSSIVRSVRPRLGDADAVLTAGPDHPAWCAVREMSAPGGSVDLTRDPSELIESLASAALPLTKQGKPHTRWVTARDRVVAAASAERWAAVLDDGLVEAAMRDGGTFSAVPYPDEMLAPLRELSDLAVAHELVALGDRNRALAAFLALCAGRLETSKRRLGQWSFADVPRLLLEAQRQHDADSTYFRLDGRIRHVLFDEFQDTSVAQFRLLEPIAGEIGQEDGREGRSVVVVGDPKQTLYGWREAEPGLADEIDGRWGQVSDGRLDRSFRSSPAVLDAVNAVFGPIAENSSIAASRPATDAARRWHASFATHAAAHPDRPGRTRLIVSEEPERPSDGGEHPVAWAEPMVRCVRDAIDSGHAGSIAVLVRRNASVVAAIDALGAAGISASEQAGRPLTDSRLVAGMVSLLRFAARPGDSLSLHHACVSSVGRVFGMPTAAGPARDVAAISLSRSVREALEARGPHGFVRWLRSRVRAAGVRPDPVDHARLAAAAETAASLERGGRPARVGPLELADHLARARSSTGESHAVRVMTVHRSKGLEFDSVVVADLDTPWRPRADAILTRRASPLDPPDLITLPGHSRLRNRVPWLSSLFDQHVSREVYGELSVLYVAMTRARRTLDLITTERITTERVTTTESSEPLSAETVLRATPVPPHAVADARGGWTLDQAGEQPVVTQPSLSPRDVRVRVRADRSLDLRTAELPVAAPSRTPDAVVAFGRSNDRLRRRGLRWHAMFELVGFANERPPTGEALAAASNRADPTLDAGERGEESRAFLAAIGDPSSQCVLTRPDVPEAGSVELHREWAFAVRVPLGEGGAPVLLNGRIDRLTVVRDAKKRAISASLVDLKISETGEPANPDAKRHKHQLDAYRHAVSRVLGLELEDVTTNLLIIGLGGSTSPSVEWVRGPNTREAGTN